MKAGESAGSLTPFLWTIRVQHDFTQSTDEEDYFVANIKSQIKRIKTNEKARLRNKAIRSSLKTSIRKFRDVLAGGDQKAIAAELRSASKALNIAVAKGVIHSNQAANKKSSMAKTAQKAGVR